MKVHIDQGDGFSHCGRPLRQDVGKLEAEDGRELPNVPTAVGMHLTDSEDMCKQCAQSVSGTIVSEDMIISEERA